MCIRDRDYTADQFIILFCSLIIAKCSEHDEGLAIRLALFWWELCGQSVFASSCSVLSCWNHWILCKRVSSFMFPRKYREQNIGIFIANPGTLPRYFWSFVGTLWRLVVLQRWAGPLAQLSEVNLASIPRARYLLGRAKFFSVPQMFYKSLTNIFSFHIFHFSPPPLPPPHTHTHHHTHTPNHVSTDAMQTTVKPIFACCTWQSKKHHYALF